MTLYEQLESENHQLRQERDDLLAKLQAAEAIVDADNERLHQAALQVRELQHDHANARQVILTFEEIRRVKP